MPQDSNFIGPPEAGIINEGGGNFWEGILNIAPDIINVIWGKPEVPGTTTPNPAPVIPGANTPEKDNTILYIGGGVALVLFITVLILIFKK